MAIKETVQIDVETNADKTADDLTSAIKDLQKAIEKMTGSMNDGFAEANDNIGKVDKGVQDIGKSAENSQKVIKGLGTGFKGLGVAIKAAGIGLLLSAMEILKELFDNNQKTVDFFNTTFNTLQVAFSDFAKWVTSNTSKFTDFFKAIFEDPLGAVQDLGNAIKDNIIERFNSLLDTLGYVGDAMQKFFQGDFQGALDSVKSAGKEMVDVFTGVNNSADKIANAALAVGEYAKETIKQGQAMTEVNKQAEIAEVLAQGLIEKYDLQAEKLRQVRDDERFAIEERIKANNDLKAVLEQQEEAMLSNAQRIVDAKARQLALDENNIEFQKEYLAAVNELAGVQAQVAGFRSEQLMNEMALERELLELNRGKIEAENEAAEMEKQAAIDAEIDVIKRIELEKELAKAKKDARIKLIEDELALTQQGTLRYQELLNERLLAEAEYNSESNRLDQESEQEKINRRMETQQAITQMAVQGLDAISALSEAFAGESEAQQRRAFQVQKALSAANTVVSTIEAAQNAYSTAQKSPITAAFPAYPAIQAGLATAFGVAKLRQIQNSKFESPEAPTETSAPTGAAFTPSFNVVGASGTNQIAQSLRQQGPVRAYVVGSDVSSQQEMDRKRVKNATL